MDNFKEKLLRILFVYEGDKNKTITLFQYMLMLCFCIVYICFIYYLMN